MCEEDRLCWQKKIKMHNRRGSHHDKSYVDLNTIKRIIENKFIMNK